MEPLTWNSQPPTGVAFQTHKFGIFDVLHEARARLIEKGETVGRAKARVGVDFAMYVQTLPHFSSKSTTAVSGELGLIDVVEDSTLDINEAEVSISEVFRDKVEKVDRKIKVQIVNEPVIEPQYVEEVSFDFCPSSNSFTPATIGIVQKRLREGWRLLTSYPSDVGTSVTFIWHKTVQVPTDQPGTSA